eukprot:PhM_4_TR18669/c0_g1_i4/m.19955
MFTQEQQKDAEYLAGVGVVDAVENAINEVIRQRPASSQEALDVMIKSFGGEVSPSLKPQSSPSKAIPPPRQKTPPRPTLHIDNTDASPKSNAGPGFFSPTHFQHNLFSPFVEESQVHASPTARLPAALARNDTSESQQRYMPE